MPLETRLPRRQFIENSLKAAGIAAFPGLASACAPEQPSTSESPFPAGALIDSNFFSPEETREKLKVATKKFPLVNITVDLSTELSDTLTVGSLGITKMIVDWVKDQKKTTILMGFEEGTQLGKEGKEWIEKDEKRQIDKPSEDTKASLAGFLFQTESGKAVETFSLISKTEGGGLLPSTVAHALFIFNIPLNNLVGSEIVFVLNKGFTSYQRDRATFLPLRFRFVTANPAHV